MKTDNNTVLRTDNSTVRRRGQPLFAREIVYFLSSISA
nr:MAG TPA: hypothetical protein [Caudoviricetes sp.]